MSEKTPKADEFGRYRVSDKDTGHQLSIPASALPHGNFTVLDEPASDVAGDARPPVYATTKPLSSTTTSGQSAGTEKEKANG